MATGGVRGTCLDTSPWAGLWEVLQSPTAALPSLVQLPALSLYQMQEVIQNVCVH